VLLFGLGLNSLFGWWWADPVAALIIAIVAAKEGREAWRGDGCCAPLTVSPAVPGEADTCGCQSGCSCRGSEDIP